MIANEISKVVGVRIGYGKGREEKRRSLLQLLLLLLQGVMSRAELGEGRGNLGQMAALRYWWSRGKWKKKAMAENG